MMGQSEIREMAESAELKAHKARIRGRKRYWENRERLLREAAAWRASNPEYHRNYGTVWRSENQQHVADYNAAWVAAHPEYHSDYNAAWYSENCAYAKKRSANWRTKNPLYAAESSAAWRVANPRYGAEYAKTNSVVLNERTARRRVVLLNAMPSWLTPSQLGLIARAYEVAKWMTEVSSEPWQVDHIVPLQGKHVCGLHVDWNLQVIPAYDNLKKGNRMPPPRMQICREAEAYQPRAND